jgi:hypothetical protein
MDSSIFPQLTTDPTTKTEQRKKMKEPARSAASCVSAIVLETSHRMDNADRDSKPHEDQKACLMSAI